MIGVEICKKVTIGLGQPESWWQTATEETN